VSFLNVGGGFGIPHRASDPVVDLGAIEARLTTLRQSLAHLQGETPALLIESGRYIFGDGGVFVCQVVDVKRSRAGWYVLVDCGITGCSRPALRWGEEHPVWKLGDPLGAGTPYTVVGPTCLPGDVLGENVILERPQVGDLIVVGCAGAYGYTMSMRDWG